MATRKKTTVAETKTIEPEAQEVQVKSVSRSVETADRELNLKKGLNLGGCESGGGGGTSNYQDLDNKPQINSVELNGNKSASDLGLATAAQGTKADTAVQQVTVGTTTTGNAGTNASVTNSGTATAPVLSFTIPRGADGQDGADAVNPFKGWYASANALPANPVVGDYAYVKSANASDPAAIYECTTAGTWSDSGRTADTSNVQTFASGEEVNEVGIDTIPTEGSDNIVTSGGVWSSIKDNTFQPKDYESASFSDGNATRITGYSLGTPTDNQYSPYGKIVGFVTGSSRKIVEINLQSNVLNNIYPLVKLKVTANATNAAVFAFCASQYKIGNTLYGYFCIDGERHIVEAGQTEILDIPKGTTRIVFTEYSTVDNTPSYIGFMRDVLPCNDLKDYVDNFCVGFTDFANKTCYSTDILFTSNQIPSGETVNLSLNIPTSGQGIGYIGIYDNQGNLLQYFGRGSITDTTSNYTGSVVLTDGYYLARLVETVNGVVIGVHISTHGDEKDIFAEYEQYELSNVYATANNVYLNKNTLQWETNGHTGRVYKVVSVPEGKKFVKVKSNGIISVQMAFLSSWETPVNNAFPDFSNDSMRIFQQYGEYEIPIPKATKYIAIQTHNTTIDISPIYFGFDSSLSVMSQTLDMYNETEKSGRKIKKVSCPNAATVVMATTDANATQYDDSLLGYFNVVKVSDSLYYMYYSCIGANETLVDDNSQHLAFAYSTDGVNWTRSIPSGIGAPIPGTNLLFAEKVIGAQVFIVQDEAYPFRMLASYNRKKTYMYKSADGVNFVFLKEVFPFYCDNQVSCIVRGNIVKVYIRWRSDISGESTIDKSYRWIGVCTIDINGNVICPPTTFFGLNLYQASASILDEEREIAFPTYYNYAIDKQSIQCYIIDKQEISRVLLDTSNMIGNDELSYYVAPGLVDVAGKTYLYMSTRTTSHNGGSASRVCRVKMVEVVFQRQGTYWLN